MAEEISHIGERLKGLRDVLDLTVEEIASVCDTTPEHYLRIEAGDADPSVYRLAKIARHYGVDINALLFGEEPRMSKYFLTRNGQGARITRNKAYIYENLASGFRGRQVEPFMVVVEPLKEGQERRLNSHDGQEFIYILEGQLEVTIGDKTLVLSVGDSLYFDASQPHCMKALNGECTKFLAMVI